MKKTLLRGGILVSPKGLKKADILISGEKIVAVGRHIKSDAAVVDVGGKLIFPGFIDPHTHFDYEVGGIVTADDFDSGSKAAVAGGVTTVVDFATQKKGESLSDTLNTWHVKAFANSSCDYAFHMTITDWRREVRDELPAMFEQGVSSFKTFMIYDDMAMTDTEIYEIMSVVKAFGGMPACHCENAGIISKLREESVGRGEIAPACHAKTRPDYAEAEAVRRYLTIAEAVGAPVMVVHLSSKEALDEVERARMRGVQVYAETCPQYLLLDDSMYEKPFSQSAGYICSPPLRKSGDMKALWQALKTGAIQTVATDHCSYTPEQKAQGAEDFTKIPNGMPGVENRAVLMYTYGVKKKRISLQQMCGLLSENPARLYGMYPKKGALKVGSDADIVVFDPNAQGTVTAASSRSKCGYSPYEGVRTAGAVERVYLRGRLVFSDGEIALEHSGRFVPRGTGSL